MDLFEDLPEPSSDPTSIQQTTREIKGADSNEPTPMKRKCEGAQINETSHKKSTTDIYRLRGHHAESKGERENMQDAYMIIDNYLPQVTDPDPALRRLSYYGVFDGHGGSRASQYAADNLHVTLAKNFPSGNLVKIESEIKKCLVESFKKTDEDFLSEATKIKPAWKDGSTAVTILAINNTVYIGNLGDSKAVLCRYNPSTHKYTALPLTKDHSPELYEERIRIQKSGGHVRDGRVMGVLEVSRSLGDGPYKKHGVICLPDIKKCQLTAHDKYILIACDGLWKTLSPDEAISHTNKLLEDPSIEGTDLKSQEVVRWETACVGLVSEAVRRLSADNVTVLLVSIS